MIFRNYVRLALIILSAFFISCKKDNDDALGVNLISATDLQSSKVITIPIETQILLDSRPVVTDGAASLWCGKYSDGHIGNLTAISYFQLRQASESPGTGTAPVCDSVEINLPYYVLIDAGTKLPGIFGDSTLSQTFDFFTLKNGFEPRTYTSSDSVSLNPTSVGQVTFTPRPSSGSLVAKLSSSLGDEIISKATGVSTDLFVSQFYGLAMKPSSSSSFGGIVQFAISESMTVKVYYHNVESASQILEFKINSGSKRFNQTIQDKSSTPLSSLKVDGDKVSTSLTNNACLIASGLGIHTLLSIPSFESIMDTLGTVVINKAEINFVVSSGSNTSLQTEPSTYLAMYYTKDGRIAYGSDDKPLGLFNGKYYLTPSEDTKYVYYNRSNKIHTLDLTHYLGARMNGSTDANPIAVSSFSNTTRFQRTVWNDPLSPSSPLVLKMYYTKVRNK